MVIKIRDIIERNKENLEVAKRDLETFVDDILSMSGLDFIASGEAMVYTGQSGSFYKEMVEELREKYLQINPEVEIIISKEERDIEEDSPEQYALFFKIKNFKNKNETN